MPQYHGWPTDFERFKQYAKKTYNREAYREVCNVSFADFFERRLEQFNRGSVPPFRPVAEKFWQDAGQLYYNVHPQIVGHLARIDLSRIPCELVELPSQSAAINIRFCEANDDLTLQETRESTWSHGRTVVRTVVPSGSWLHSLLMVDARRIGEFKAAPQIRFILDFGGTQQFGEEYNNQVQPTYGIFTMSVESGTMMEDAFQKSIADRGYTENQDYFRVVNNCLKLAVAIGFLASSCSELVTPDVLSKYRDEYFSRTTTPERKRWIEDKSQRRGKNTGWNVGNDVLFLEGFTPAESRKGGGTGRELSHAHTRTGHFHAVRYGEKHSKVKIMWFRPTVVRDDLPFEKGG